jgi:signal transduction histidine kinase
MLAMSGSGVTRLAGREMAWAAYPMQAPDSLDLRGSPAALKGKVDPFGVKGRKGTGTSRVIGAVFVLAPPKISGAPRDTPPGPVVAAGAAVLVLIVPVGALFGLLTTRRLIRRVRRLAQVTTTMADGDLRPRVEISGADEIGRLEDGFNRMAERLSETLHAERGRADADGRRTERARISRELHDSISQDLFSLSLLAGGMRKALPEGSGLRPEAQTMERTAARAMREMQALLLELRPVVLDDLGLVPAIAELCGAYEERLGIRVEPALADVRLEPVAESAVLRIVQEAVGNAVRHGVPEKVRVTLAGGDGQVRLEISDDGRGFDVGRAGERHGMGLDLMRERAAELGGALEVTSAPGDGTTVRVRLPEGAS